jgi:CrcB protein
MLTNMFYVGLGGAIGAMLRYGIVQHIVMRLHPGAFPLGTMLVNILGALAIGMVLTKCQDTPLRLLLVSGVLGGFTTFSAFSWDTLQLMQQGHTIHAIAYVLGSVLLCIVGVYLGIRLMGGI